MTDQKSKYNLSFAGCGFLGLYHAGVCGCIQEFAPHLYQGQKVSGASAGAIAAAFLFCDVKISDCVHYLMQTINTARSYMLGPFDPRFKITQHLREGLELYLPEDAHIRCSGNLHISMTNQATGENYIAKNYKDRNELIKAILCSSYIPIFSGFIPLTFRGEWMIDGALTKNTLELDSNTITISPFSGDADICPRDDWGYGQIYITGTSFLVNPENMHRLLNIFWPKSPEELGKLTQLGYSNALQFLARKGFIKCDLHRCHTIFMKMKVSTLRRVTDESCKKCRKNLKKALHSALSTSVISSFKATEKNSEKQIINYLKLLSHAATLPLRIVMKIIRRCVILFKASPRHLVGSFLDVVRTLISLDDVFKKALSNSMESNYRHSILCDALENVRRMSYCKEFIDDDESGYSESEESLFDGSDDCELDLKNNIDDNDYECFRNRIEDFGGVLDSVHIESYDDDSDNNGLPCRPDVTGAEDDETVQCSTRGEADGKDSDAASECTLVHSDCDLSLDLDHQMTWSYTDSADSTEINYFIIAPVLDPSYTDSMHTL